MGGYVWLVWYNHDGEHRRWHGISTVILFVAATLLNIALCIRLHFYLHPRQQFHWLWVALLATLQLASVIAFFLTYVFLQSQPNTIVAGDC